MVFLYAFVCIIAIGLLLESVGQLAWIHVICCTGMAREQYLALSKS